jgi:hypothetical protein
VAAAVAPPDDTTTFTLSVVDVDVDVVASSNVATSRPDNKGKKRKNEE